MLFRPTTASDLDRFLPLIVADAAGGITADTYTARISTGEYRLARTWIEEDAPGAVPSVLAVWWGAPDADLPGALDGLFVHDSIRSADERTALASGLLATAHAAFAEAGVDTAPDYRLTLPGDWRARPDSVDDLVILA